MDEQYIEEVARVTIKILKDKKAVRLADNLNPEGIDVKDLLAYLEDKGFPISQTIYYNHIRSKCQALGYGITACGTGQFIGGKGEAIARNTHKSRNQVIGRTKNIKKNLTAASEAMTLEEGNKYSKIHFNMDLAESANVFKAVGKAIGDVLLPWPKELHDYLLESQSDGQ